MAYTAIVVLDNIFLTSFTFDAPHDRSAAYKQACEMWADKSDYLRQGPLNSHVCSIVPGYHEPYTHTEE
jgi:hypothetical protein